MEDREPTYEEFVNARKYARFKYKYGIFVLIACWICLLFLCYFIYSYGEELRSNPMIYAMRKANLDCDCYCTNSIGKSVFLELNSTSLIVNRGIDGLLDQNFSDIVVD